MEQYLYKLTFEQDSLMQLQDFSRLVGNSCGPNYINKIMNRSQTYKFPTGLGH